MFRAFKFAENKKFNNVFYVKFEFFNENSYIYGLISKIRTCTDKSVHLATLVPRRRSKI